ncbi:SDR family NAD(P)-dependent oxidoreductase [Rhizobium helianthi]|uniref:SDR family NAD(P)-dependent oxidoreductase n=1 Tax=Rhizobium helianthi TaxID=1132695 RepID=A0ABW4M2L1_9HYPH
MFKNALPLIISGDSKAALVAAAEHTLATLEATTDEALQAFAINTIRQRHGKHRGAVLAKDRQGFVRGLTALSKGRSPRNVLVGEEGTAQKPVFVFPGLGLTWPGMTGNLLRHLPVYRQHFQHYSDLFNPLLHRNLVDELLTDRAFEDLQSVQPLLFSVPSALANVWRAFGVTERATVGHSVGEIAAAHACGALTGENAANLIDLWMRQLGPIEGQGGMISVSASAERIAPLLEPWKNRLFLGAFNSPDGVTICGEAKAIAEIAPVLEEKGFWTWAIPGGVVAGHTPLVEYLRGPIEAQAPSRPGGRMTSRFYSAVSGKPLSEDDLTAQYWFSTLREPVYFEKAIRALVNDGHRLFIEVTANPVLTPVIQQVLQSMQVTGAAVPTLDSRLDDRDSLIQSFAHAYVNGAAIHWDEALRLVLSDSELAAMGTDLSATSRSATQPQPISALSGEDFVEADALRALSETQQKAFLLDLIARETEAVLGHGYASETDKFLEIGFTSLALVELAEALTAALGIDVSATAVFSHPTPLALAAQLRIELGLAEEVIPASAIRPTGRADDNEPIAIVGMACRYPGGIDTLEALWALLDEGRDAIGDLPKDRDWDGSRLYDPIPGRLGKLYQQQGGFLNNASEFDAGFFGIAPREALSMEPQQRLMLEISWEALERAGIDPATLHGSNAGVFVGIMPQEYGPPIEQATEDMSGYRYMGTAACVASGRLAYVLGLMGPTLSVDTACSSSLTAIHLACDALRNNDCPIALAGGTTVMSTPGVLIDFSRLQALAPDGRCKAFSSSADGVGLAEGAGVLVLQRLSTALAEGREILAIIAGSAVNQDGASNGLSAPNGAAQQRVIRHALARAGWSAQDVDALDAHGTGTRLGDPIEADAIIATYGQGREQAQPLLLGSIKSNLGHTQAAAGVASVIKMTLAMQHGRLPRSLHIDRPSDAIDWSRGAVKLLEQPQSWQAGQSRPRRAAISSFGVSGTNGHLLLEEAPVLKGGVSPKTPIPHDLLLPLSAKTPTALREQAGRLHDRIHKDETLDLVDAGFTLATGRSRFAVRGAVWGSGRSEIAEALKAIAEGVDHPSAVHNTPAPSKLVFVFPGQGAQWPRMGMELYETQPAFRAALDEVDGALLPHTGWSVLAALRGDAGAPSPLRVDVVQPALFAVSVALARLWQSLGIVPDAIVGHSFGEIAGAHIAGALTLADAARLAALRAKTLAEAPVAGTMATIGLSEQRTRTLIEKSGRSINPAVFNSPSSTVVSGSAEDMAVLLQLCEAEGIYAKRIAVDVLAHSPELRVLCPTLNQRLGEIVPQRAKLHLYSTVDGHAGKKPLSGEELDLTYWGDNLCNPVRFVDTISHLAAEGNVTFLECSPQPILLPAIEETADLAPTRIIAIGTLKRTLSAKAAISEAAGRLFAAGHEPDWHAFFPDAKLACLPTYPFERSRYWLPAQATQDVAAAGQRVVKHALLSAIIDLPNQEGVVLTGRVGLKSQPWMADHGAGGVVLVPASAYVDMVLEAAAKLGASAIEELVLQAPMVLEETGMLDIQLRVDARTEDGFWPVSLYSRKSVEEDNQPPADWELNATGSLASAADKLDILDEAWPSVGAREEDLVAFRERLALAGYDYGPAFRGLTRLWRAGQELFAEVELPEGLKPGGHFLHPALLDAALQPIALPWQADSADALRLPFSLSGVTCTGDAVTRLRVRLTMADTESIRVRAFDEKGAPVIAIDKLTLRPANREALRGKAKARPDRDLLELIWSPLPAAAKPAAEIASLEKLVLLQPADALLASLPGFAACAGIEELDETQTPPSTIVWTLPQMEAADLPLRTRSLNETVLSQLQQFSQSTALANSVLVILTQRAVTTSLHEVPDPAHASAWSLIHSAQNEMPDRFILIDVDQLADLGDSLKAALGTGRPQVAIRGKMLFTPSLTRIDAMPLLSVPVDEASWRLDLVHGEGIEALDVVSNDRGRAPLAHGQIRVEVRAAGLNFYDTASAMGLVAKRHDFGAEAAGIVVEAGPGVDRFAPGDRVVVMAEGCFSAEVVADTRMASHFPAHWSFAQAASVPIAFVTSYYALVEMAKIKPGERVLIHAGAGGVGQSAIQLARYLGAEIFVTASPKKWPVLRALGIPQDHIANSRNLDFAEQFRRVSGGAGMDVVINSLAGKFIDKTMEIMAVGGRFVEIGKTDVRNPEQVRERHPQIAYHYLDWGVTSGFEKTGQIFNALMRLFAQGALQPLPLTAVAIQQAQDALRMMQQARHTGKIVLTMPQQLNPEGTVLITGGTGTLGALLAEHLVTAHGVKRLLLVSRSGAASPDAESVRSLLQAHGAEVDIKACDTADPTALKSLLDAIPAQHPLTGIFHTAGVLADATIANLTAEQIGKVFAPKVDAAWHLHDLTKHMDLAVFALYSSINGVLGNAGQGNYAAANTFLDSLAIIRRRLGLPATSLGWGWWRPVTNLSRAFSAADTARIARVGFAPITVEHGNALLDAAINSPFPALAASPFNQQTLDENRDIGVLHPLLMGLVGANSLRRGRSAADKAADLMRELKTLASPARLKKVEALITQQTLATLGLGEGAKLKAEDSFKDIGIDSLMALSLRNQVNMAFGLRLPATLIYDFPAPRILAEHLVERLFPDTQADEEAQEQAPSESEEAEIRSRISSIPLSRLRGLGLLETLLQLASGQEGPHFEKEPQTLDKIQSASVDELLKLATSKQVEELL